MSKDPLEKQASSIEDCAIQEVCSKKIANTSRVSPEKPYRTTTSPSATLTISGISGIGADLDATTDNHFTGSVGSQPKIIWYASYSGYTLGRYEVEIFDTTSPTQNLVCAVETTTMSYIVMSSTCGSNLNTGSDYEIKVTAFDTSDTVITSERLLFTPPRAK